MLLYNEKEIAKALLTYKETALELWDLINFSRFDQPIVRTCIFITKAYLKEYGKFPNKTEAKVYLARKLDLLDLPVEKEQRKIALAQIDALLSYLDKSPETTQDILNIEQLKEECEKFLKQKIFLGELKKLRSVIKSGKFIEEALERIKTKLQKHTVAFEKGKGIKWFCQLESPVRGKLYRTGFEFLDKWMGGGLGIRELALLGAGVGVGKTTFLTSLACNYAKLYGDELLIVYITLEQSEEQIWAKIVSNYLKIPYSEFTIENPSVIIPRILEKQGISPEQMMYHLNNIYIKHFIPKTSIFEIAKYIKKLKMSEDNRDIIFIIDYVNEINYPGKEKWESLELIGMELDALCQELNVAIWFAAQAHKKSSKKDVMYFRETDLYGAKVGLTKKLSFGLGLKRDPDNGIVYLSFFKNREFGQVLNYAIVKHSRDTSQIDLQEIEMMESKNIDKVDEIASIESSEASFDLDDIPETTDDVLDIT